MVLPNIIDFKRVGIPVDIDSAKELMKKHYEILEKSLKGTTTVGLVTRNATILAADKRATAGVYVAHKHVKKIIKITDYVAMTTAGLVADAQAIADYLRAQAHYHYVSTGIPMSIKSMAYLLGLILNSSKYFPYIVQLLVGGYDHGLNRPVLYAVEMYGDITEERYTATGSGSPIAIGVIESGYADDLDTEEGVLLAVKAVGSAILRDAFSGEGVDVVVISKDHYEERTYPLNEVKKIVSREGHEL